MQIEPQVEEIPPSEPNPELGDKPPAELVVSRTIWTALKSTHLAQETPFLYNAIKALEERVLELEGRHDTDDTSGE